MEYSNGVKNYSTSVCFHVFVEQLQMQNTPVRSGHNWIKGNPVDDWGSCFLITTHCSPGIISTPF